MLVVLAHLHNVEAKYCVTHLMWVFQYGVLGVDLFFVISGVVIASVTAGRFGDRHEAGNFLYRRFARIFPAFWFYTSVLLIVYLCHPNWFNVSTGGKVNILASYLLVPTSTPMLVRQGWTLSFEIYFYLLVALLMFIVPQKSVSFMLACSGIIAVAIGYLLPLQAPTVLRTLCDPLLLEFLAGFAIFHVYRKVKLHPAFGAAMVCLAFLWLGTVIWYNASIQGWDSSLIVDNGWQRTFIFGTFACLLISGVVEMERTGLVRYFHFLEDIGDWSYSIYLSHLMIVEIVARTTHHFAHGMHGEILLIDLISVPMVLFIGYLSNTYMEKPIAELLKRGKPLPRLSAASGLPSF